MKIDELSRKLLDAARKMENDKNKYSVHEVLEAGHGEGNYKLSFHAKKKGGFGLLSTVARMASSAIYGGVSGLLREASYEIGRRTYRATFEPIDQEMTGAEIASLLRRWSETVKEGYIETIGSTLLLPEDHHYISASIKPGKEIRLVIDFARLREVSASPPSEEEQDEEEVSTLSSAPVQVPIPKVVVSSFPMNQLASTAYVTGSLKNTEDGFQLLLQNTFAPVTVIAPIKLVVDGENVPLKSIELLISGNSVASLNISQNNPVIFNIGDQMVIKVKGKNLPPGSHAITIKTTLNETGPIVLPIKDTI